MQDYVNGQKPTLILRPTSRLEFEIGNCQCDQLTIDGDLSYYNIKQDFSTSTDMPRLRIKLAENAMVKEGLEFTLLTAKGKTSYENVEWNFDVRYPKKMICPGAAAETRCCIMTKTMQNLPIGEFMPHYDSLPAKNL